MSLSLCVFQVPVSQLSLSSPVAEAKVAKKKKKDTGEKMAIPPPNDSFKKHYRRLESRAFKVLLGCATNSIMLDVQDTEGPAPTRVSASDGPLCVRWTLLVTSAD